MSTSTNAQRYIQELISALEYAITEKKKKKTQICKLNTPLSLKQEGTTYHYKFSLPNIKLSKNDTLYYLQYDSQEVECQLQALDASAIQISVEVPLPENCKSVTLVKDNSALLAALQDRYKSVELEKQYQSFQHSADIFDGVLTHRKSQSVDLRRYGNLNQSQQGAVIASLFSDTLIWGPPGTGKTQVIAAAIQEHLRAGHRVLLLSHANTAVDGALKRVVPDPHKPQEHSDSFISELYENGQLLRLGKAVSTEFEEYPLLLMDNIVAQKSAAIQSQIDAVKLDLQSLRNRKSLLNETKKKKKDVDVAKRTLNAIRDKQILCKSQVTEADDARSKHIQNINRLLDSIEIHKASALKRFIGKKRIANLEQQLLELVDGQELLDRNLSNSRSRLQAVQTEISKAAARYESLLEDYTRLLELLALPRSNPQIQKELTKVQKKIDKLNTDIEHFNKQKSEMRNTITASAKVIGTTLTQTYLSQALMSQQFDCVFIDEISMAPLWTVFWALSLVTGNCVFIGDFLQLPPVSDFKNEAARYWTAQSLFDILKISTVSAAQNCPHVSILQTQYRMNPDIAFLSNHYFYGDILENGENTRKNIINEDSICSSTPLVLVDTSRENPRISTEDSASRYNTYNAAIACNIAVAYLQNIPSCSIGIVVPYRPQALHIQKLFTQECKRLNLDASKVMINTIHSYQGSENDIIIFDSVEGPGRSSWFFLDEGCYNNVTAKLLLNVAITRAKSKLIFIANNGFIQKNFSDTSIFKKMLDHRYFSGTTLSSGRFEAPNQQASPLTEIPPAAQSEISGSTASMQALLKCLGSTSDTVKTDFPAAQSPVKPAIKTICCPICGRSLVIRSSRYGKFMGCCMFAASNCRFTMPIPQYILEFIMANGLNVYGWNKTCWNCGKDTMVYTYHPYYDLYVLGEEIVYSALWILALGEIPKLDQYMLTRFPDKIKHRFSQTRNEKYAANICQHCGKIQGNWYLINDPHGTDQKIWEALCHPEERLLDKYFIENIPYHKIRLTLNDINDFIWSSTDGE